MDRIPVVLAYGIYIFSIISIVLGPLSFFVVILFKLAYRKRIKYFRMIFIVSLLWGVLGLYEYYALFYMLPARNQRAMATQQREMFLRFAREDVALVLEGKRPIHCSLEDAKSIKDSGDVEVFRSNGYMLENRKIPKLENGVNGHLCGVRVTFDAILDLPEICAQFEDKIPN